MTWLRTIFVLVGGIGAISSQATSPPLDNTAAFFVGDWIGVGAQDTFCLVRLGDDGRGTVLVSGGSGDWLGATIRWRNQHQSIVLIEVSPLPAEPRRRLMPLHQLVLHSGINRTTQLKLSEGGVICELQLRADVLRRAGQAEQLLNAPTDAGAADGER